MTQQATPRIIIGGCREFVDSGRRAAEGKLVVAGEVFSPKDLYAQVDITRPDGVLVPAEWAKTAVDIAYLRPNVKVFSSGNVDMETYNKLAAGKVMTTSEDAVKAVRIMLSVLMKISPTRFTFEDPGGQPGFETGMIPGIAVVNTFTAAIYSTKGGAGKTTIATNSAAATGMWARRAEKKGKALRTALLDFNTDYGSGDVAMGFAGLGDGLKTVVSWQDLSMSSSWDEVRQCMNYHEKSNVYYLAPPLYPGERGLFTAEVAERVLALTKKYFHFVFIDLGVALDKRDAAVVALDKATNVLLVIDFDYESVKKLASFFKYEARHIFSDLPAVSLVINKTCNSWFGVNDILNLLESEGGLLPPPRARLPEDREISRHKGKGAPLVCLKPESPFSAEIIKLCSSLVGTEMNRTRKKISFKNPFFRNKKGGG